MAAISAPRRGRPIGRPTGRATAKRKPRPFFNGLRLGRRAIHARRSLAGVAPPRLRASAVSRFVIFVIFVIFVAFAIFVIFVANRSGICLPNSNLNPAIPRIVHAVGRLRLTRRVDCDHPSGHSKAGERIGSLPRANGPHAHPLGHDLTVGQTRCGSEPRHLDTRLLELSDVLREIGQRDRDVQAEEVVIEIEVQRHVAWAIDLHP